jgi:hypothetical protein
VGSSSLSARTRRAPEPGKSARSARNVLVAGSPNWPATLCASCTTAHPRVTGEHRPHGGDLDRIWVIDAKKYKGRPLLQVEGGILRARTEKIFVGSRDCTKLVDGMLKQIQVVEGAIGVDVPVHGVLCFVEADWPLIGGAFRTSGVEVTWPKKLFPKLHEPGPIDPADIDHLHRRLATSLPPA